MPPPRPEPEPQPRPEPDPKPAPARTTRTVALVLPVVDIQGRLEGPELGALPYSWKPGAVLRTRGGPAALKLADDTLLSLGAGSTLRLDSARPPTVTLESGNVYSDVVPGAGRNPRLILRTSHASITVLGTRFSVVRGDRATRVAVMKGRVQVTRTRDGRSIVVREGQYARVADGVFLTPRALPSNLVADSGFEENGAAWTGTYHPDGRPWGGITIGETQARSGRRAVLLSSTRVVGRDREVYQDFPARPGETFEVSGWLRVEGIGRQGASLSLL